MILTFDNSLSDNHNDCGGGLFDFQLPINNLFRKSRPNYNYDSQHHEVLNQLKEAQARARELIQNRKIENKKQHDKKNYANLPLK